MSRNVTFSRTLLALAFTGLILAGCQSGYRAAAGRMDAALLAGDVPSAAKASYEEFKADANNRDRVVRALDAGSLLLLAGQARESTEALSSAYESVRPYLDTKAESSVSEGVGTTLVNQTISEYRATPMERILLSTMQAINRLTANDMAAARVELNRAHDWQRDAEAKYASEIERDREAVMKSASSKGLNLGAAVNDPKLARLAVGLEDVASSAAYQSAWSSYLRAAFLASTSREVGDVSTARSEWRRVQDQSPESRGLVEEDLAALERSSPQPTTWVFVFSGLCPRREELRLDIPIPIGDVNYVSAAFPVLKVVPAHGNDFTVATAGATGKAVLLMNVDRSVQAEYKTRLPAIIAQELLSTALKAAATYAAKKATSDKYGSLALQIGGIAYQASTTAADLRAWRALPKCVYVARVPTPDDGIVTITAPGAAPVLVHVQPNSSNGTIVWQTQPTATSAPSVRWSMPYQGGQPHTAVSTAPATSSTPASAAVAPDAHGSPVPAAPVKPGRNPFTRGTPLPKSPM